MAKQTINIGAAPNDGTGDPLRPAFDKVNDNFDELYSSLATVQSTVISNNNALDARLDSLEASGSIIQHTETSFSLTLSEANDYLECTNSSAIALTVPANASVAFPVGTVITIDQGGSGAVTVTPAAGVTIQVAATHTRVTNGQFAVVQIKKKATNTWIIFGNLVAV